MCAINKIRTIMGEDDQETYLGVLVQPSPHGLLVPKLDVRHLLVPPGIRACGEVDPGDLRSERRR